MIIKFQNNILNLATCPHFFLSANPRYYRSSDEWCLMVGLPGYSKEDLYEIAAAQIKADNYSRAQEIIDKILNELMKEYRTGTLTLDFEELLKRMPIERW